MQLDKSKDIWSFQPKPKPTNKYQKRLIYDLCNRKGEGGGAGNIEKNCLHQTKPLERGKAESWVLNSIQ